MKIYRVRHSEEGFAMDTRYFDNLESAKELFNLLRKHADESEYIELDEMEISNADGEFIKEYVRPLAYWSDDTKCGSEYFE